MFGFHFSYVNKHNKHKGLNSLQNLSSISPVTIIFSVVIDTKYLSNKPKTNEPLFSGIFQGKKLRFLFLSTFCYQQMQYLFYIFVVFYTYTPNRFNLKCL